jgi:hypothetical protein
MCCGLQIDPVKLAGTLRQPFTILLHAEQEPALVRGPITGRMYPLSRTRPAQSVQFVQSVTAQNASATLQTPPFRSAR